MPDKLPDDDPLLTPREVAELFGVRTTTITRWAPEGTLTALRTPGGHRRYRRQELQRPLDEDDTAPDPATQRLAEEATRLYANDWSIRQIAAEFDRDYGATAPASTAKTDPESSAGSR